MQDCSNVTSFTFLGLIEDPKLLIPSSLILLLAYILIVLGNFSIIVAFCADFHLHTPMYIFLFNLSIIDIVSTLNIVPKLLSMLFTKHIMISFIGCITQMYFFASLVVTELILLTIMSYDRYVAICYPLNYIKLMNVKICAGLSIATWTAGFLDPIGHIVLISNLSFWSSKPIDHFFCDIAPLLNIACSDISAVEILNYTQAALIGIFSLLLILVSYIFIISSILKIKSVEGGRKAFSTCSSHLTCVIIYYGTIICLHMKPASSYFPKWDKLFALVYVVLVPMLNPFIYCLKNEDVKQSYVRLKTKAGHSLERLSDQFTNYRGLDKKSL